MSKQTGNRILADNRKAFHDYEILEKYTAGIVLTGTEIKAVRKGSVNLKDGFARIEDGEMWLYNVHISPYENGNRYLGCNVENASYGLALCAERNAISSAIAAGEKSKITAIAIYSPKQKKCMPCGACRQWLCEFAQNSHDTKIILEDENLEPFVLTLEEIFPFGFKFEQ